MQPVILDDIEFFKDDYEHDNVLLISQKTTEEESLGQVIISS